MSEIYTPPDGLPAVLHSDTDLLVVDKPSGLLSVPGKGAHLADCVLSRLQAAFPGVLLVHRLDRDTSGVMVFARNKAAQRHLGLQFERRHLTKTYIAVVFGHLVPDSGLIDLPLIVDWPNRPRQKVDLEHGRPALTGWRVLARSPEATRVELAPETGRSHQLRVHMAELGHPILGDPLYGRKDAPQASRLMLHAESLTLRHPDGGALMLFRAPCPF